MDETTEYEMTLLSGTPDSGAYGVIVPGVASGSHDFHFIFIDDNGEYHVQGFSFWGPTACGTGISRSHQRWTNGGP